MNWVMDRKVWAGGLSGAAAALLVWLAQAYLGMTIPAEVASFLVVSASTAVAYLVPPSLRDIVKRLDGAIIDIVSADPDIPLKRSGTVPPAAPVRTTFTGMKQLSVVIALTLLVPLLGACSSTKSITLDQAAASVKETVAAGAALSPEQKWAAGCAFAEAAHVGYLALMAQRQSPNVNGKVQAAYAAVGSLCASQPTNKAEAIVALVKAVNEFNAALPKKTIAAT